MDAGIQSGGHTVGRFGMVCRNNDEFWLEYAGSVRLNERILLDSNELVH